jgi:hypothetical protein
MDAGSDAASHRIAARELVTPERLAGLRERLEWKGIALIAHAWCVILGAMAVVTVFPNPLTYILAVMLIGSRQLGLAASCPSLHQMPVLLRRRQRLTLPSARAA